MIRIKDKESWLPLFERLFHPLLVEVFAWIYAELDFIKILTSTFRPGDPGPHGTIPCRALDLRSWHLPLSVCRIIEKKINDNWVYDPDRPDMVVCKYHKTKKGAWHFHVQVHPNTRRR